MDERLAAPLDELTAAGSAHDAREPEHGRRPLNLEPPTAALLSERELREPLA